jgi:hypothetical protein
MTHATKQETQVIEKAAKPARKRSNSSKASTKTKRAVEHNEIAKRAYFIYLDEGRSDELANWLRAERELTAV